MKKAHSYPKMMILAVLILAALLLVSCTQETQSLPRIWIDHPRANLRLPADQPLVLHSHAFAGNGLAEVVLSVDGVAYARTGPSEEGADFSQFQLEWLPPGDGTYLLQVVAYDTEGVRSNPATVSVSIGEQLAAAEPAQPAQDADQESPEEQEEQEPQPVCPPTATVSTNANCRSGPGEVYPVIDSLPAGAQADVVGQSQDGYWWVIEQPGGGGKCWIWEELVSLSNEDCQVAQVESPPPPQDVEAPPAPEPVVPQNGLSLSCRPSQTLAWLPVQDSSGIAGYHLRLEKENSPGNWGQVSSWTLVQGKQVQAAVECGLRYRWTVRAEDGAGNLSPWSGAASFSIDLE